MAAKVKNIMLCAKENEIPKKCDFFKFSLKPTAVKHEKLVIKLTNKNYTI
jgi:hypothetical protein